MALVNVARGRMSKKKREISNLSVLFIALRALCSGICCSKRMACGS
jgi:hypothetical protein